MSGNETNISGPASRKTPPPFWFHNEQSALTPLPTCTVKIGDPIAARDIEMLPVIINRDGELIVAGCTCAGVAVGNGDRQVKAFKPRRQSESKSVARAKESYGQILKSSALIGVPGRKYCDWDRSHQGDGDAAWDLQGSDCLGYMVPSQTSRRALPAWASTAAEFARLLRRRDLVTMRGSGKPRRYFGEHRSSLDCLELPCYSCFRGTYPG